MGKSFIRLQHFKDSMEANHLLTLLILTSLLATFWIVVNITEMQSVKNANIYFFMGIIAFIGIVGDWIAEKVNIKSIAISMFVGAGDLLTGVIIPLVLGGFVGFLIIFSAVGFTVNVPMGIVIPESVLRWLFVVPIASLNEEALFRGVLLGTIMLTCLKFTKNSLVSLATAVLLSSATFAIFHGYAYGWEQSLMLGAFVFGIISSSLVLLTKSIFAGIGLHLVNNYFAFINLGG